MADKGAELQNYNNELVRCIEELKEKREELHRVILKEEEEKEKLIGEIRILNEKLARVEDNLVKKYASRTEYDKTIKETEAAYLKILESSQTLLQVLKRETVNLVKKRTGPQNYS